MTQFDMICKNKLHLAYIITDASFYREHSMDSGTYGFNGQQTSSRKECIELVLDWLDSESEDMF